MQIIALVGAPSSDLTAMEGHMGDLALPDVLSGKYIISDQVSTADQNFAENSNKTGELPADPSAEPSAGQSGTIEIPVTWNLPQPAVKGDYILTPVLNLPEGYVLADGVQTPGVKLTLTADPQVEGVRQLISALPDPDDVKALMMKENATEEDSAKIEQWSDAAQNAMNAYAELTEDQQALLPQASDVFQELAAAFQGNAMLLTGDSAIEGTDYRLNWSSKTDITSIDVLTAKGFYHACSLLTGNQTSRANIKKNITFSQAQSISCDSWGSSGHPDMILDLGGCTLTYTGDRTGVAITMTDASRKVIVQNGTLEATNESGTALADVNSKTGTSLIISSGAKIISTGANGTAIDQDTSVSTIKIQSGAEVRSDNGKAINARYAPNGSILVSGGTVSSKSGTAIDSHGAVTIQRGSVTTQNGTAISHVYDGDSSGISVIGGTVSAADSGGAAIKLKGPLDPMGGEKGIGTFSDGVVSGGNGVAIEISDPYQITISGNARVTSQNQSTGTITVEEGKTSKPVVTVNSSGIVENTASVSGTPHGKGWSLYFANKDATDKNVRDFYSNNGGTLGDVYARTPVYVAQIGSNQYESLTDALKKVQAGETVTILKDISLSKSEESYPIPSDNIIIDLNGWTIKNTNTALYGPSTGIISSKGNTTLTIKSSKPGGKIESCGNYPAIDIGGGGKIIIDKNVTVTSAASSDTKGTIKISKAPAEAPVAALTVKNGGKVENTQDGYALCFTDGTVTSANVEQYYSVESGASLGRVYPTPGFTASVSLRKNDVPWNNSGKTVRLYQNGTLKYTLTGSGSTFTKDSVASGTYDIYVGSHSTGIQISGAVPVTIDYYSVTYSKGDGTLSPGASLPATDIVQKGGSHTVSSTYPVTRTGCTQIGWGRTGKGQETAISNISAACVLTPVWELAQPSVAVSAAYGTGTLTGGSADYTGDDLVFTANAVHPLSGQGTFQMQYQWYQGSNALTGKTAEKTYTVSSADADTYGPYRCVVSCTADQLTSTAEGTGPSVTIKPAAAPVTAWPEIKPIYVNDTLTDDHLINGNPGAVSGSFSVTGQKVWTTAGTPSTEVTFTPGNTINYHSVSKSAEVTVKQRTIESVTNPADVTDKEYGADFNSLGLPDTVQVIASGDKTLSLPVTWTSEEYNPTVLTEQTITGSLTGNDEVAVTSGNQARVRVTLREKTADSPSLGEKQIPFTGEPILYELPSVLPPGIAKATCTSYAGKDGTVYGPSQTAPVNAGHYTVTVSFTMEPGYGQLPSGSPTLIIQPKTLTEGDYTVSGLEESYPYTGQSIKPSVTLTLSGKPLVKDTDYTVEYGPNTEVGQNGGSISINFKGNYAGQKTLSFAISYAPLPSGTANDDIFTISGADLMNWHKEDIELKTKGDWTAGFAADSLSQTVTLSDESAKSDGTVVPSSATLFVKNVGGNIYQTSVKYKLDKTPPTITVDGMEPDGVNKIWGKEKDITIHVSDALSGMRYLQIMGQNAEQTNVEYGDPNLGLGYLSFPEDGVIPYKVKANDVYTITAYDNADNQTFWHNEASGKDDLLPTFAVEKIDGVPPTATFGDITAGDGKTGENGWLTGPVTVNVNVEDPKTVPDDPSTVLVNESDKSGIKNWEYSLDGGTTWTIGSGSSFTVNQDGDYTDKLKLRATDNAGNQSDETAAGATASVKLDQATPEVPQVEVKSGGADYVSGVWTAKPVVFTLNGTPTVSGNLKYQYKMGAGEWTDVTDSTLTHSENTPDSGVTYQFRTVNGAGKASNPSDPFTVKLRALNPSVTDSPDNKYAQSDIQIGSDPTKDEWYTQDVTVTVTKKDTINDGQNHYPADTYYKVDTGEKTKLEGNSIQITEDGQHTLEIWTEDASGNETTHLILHINLDKTKPIVTYQAGNPESWQKTDAVITFQVTDATSGVKLENIKVMRAGQDYPVTLDSGGSEPSADSGSVNGPDSTGSGSLDSSGVAASFSSSSIYRFTADQNGDYVITATDNAGNPSDSKTVVVVKIDKLAPVVTWSEATAALNPDKWYGKTALTAEVTDDSGEIPVITLTASGKSYANGAVISETGSYTFYATATDGAGNTGKSPALTVRIETAIDDFVAKVAGLNENSNYQDVLDAMKWHDGQSQTVKDRFSKSDDAKAACEKLEGLLNAKAAEAAQGVTESIQNAATIDQIDQAAKDFDALPEAAKDQISGDVKDQLNKKKADAEAARNVIEQLENADRNKVTQESVVKDPGGSLEEKQGAKDAFDKLTDDQKNLVTQTDGATEHKNQIDTDLAAIQDVLDKLDQIQKPYTPETKAQIQTVQDAYDGLTQKQKDAFPKPEKDRLDKLTVMKENAQNAEGLITGLGETPTQEAVTKAKGTYDALTPDEQSMVNGELKTQLDQKYQDMTEHMTADEKAAADFTAQVEEVKNAPAMGKIEQLIKDHDALSEGALEKLSQQTKDDYDKLKEDYNKTKVVTDKLDQIDVNNLKPEDKDQVQEALHDYDQLTDDQKKLAEDAAGDKLDTLKEAVDTVKDATDKIDAIPGHDADSSKPGPDGQPIPDFDHCDDPENPDASGHPTGGHTFEEHKAAIEAAKLAYEKLTDAGRKLISQEAKDKLNREYAALIAYLEYVNTAKTADTNVEIIGLADKVEKPAESVSAPKTTITVVMNQENPSVLPPTPAGKTEALGVDIKLMAKIYDNPNATAQDQPTSVEEVQPKAGEQVLVKLKVPAGYQNDTLEIWHVKDNGGYSRIDDFWLVTESDGTYAVFSVSSSSHFVLYAEKNAAPPTPPTPPAPPEPPTPPTPGGGHSGGGHGDKDQNSGDQYNSTVQGPVISDPDHGTAEITPSQPKPGDTVTVTPKPNPGYVADHIVVTDEKGNEVPVTENSNHTISYVQPAGKVTVTVTFKPAAQGLELPFTDVKQNDWFYDSVKYVYEEGLMSGTSEDQFSPLLNTSRGMIVTVLWRQEGMPTGVAANPQRSGSSLQAGDGVSPHHSGSSLQAAANGTPAGNGANPFTDVASDAYYAKAVAWGAENDIIEGYGNGQFGPDDPITREQLAAILHRYAAYKGMDTAAKGDLSLFTDQPDRWAAQSVAWAVGTGILSGKGNGILDPAGTATRAETAAMLTRFLQGK